MNIVLLEAPYEIWENPDVQTWFTRIIEFRKRGYQDSYDCPILPVETCDFVGTHLLLCDNDWRIQLAYRSISLAQCTRYNIIFPALSLARLCPSEAINESVGETIRRHENQPESLFFNAGFTMHKDLRKNPALNQEIKRAMMGLECLFHENKAVEVLSAGVIRFRVPTTLGLFGFEPMQHQGKVLEPVPLWFLGGEPSQLVHLREFTLAARKAALELRPVWDRRLTVGRMPNTTEIPQAA